MNQFLPTDLASHATTFSKTHWSNGRYWALFQNRLLIPYYNYSLAQYLGHQLEDMVGSRYYFHHEAHDVNPKNEKAPFFINTTAHSVYGNCFTFTPKPRTHFEL